MNKIYDEHFGHLCTYLDNKAIQNPDQDFATLSQIWASLQNNGVTSD